MSRNHSEYPADPIFFTKWQMTVGTELINMGRLENGTVWVVEKIMSYPASRARGAAVQSVQLLKDTVYLRAKISKELRVVSFATLTYSAIWRITNYRHNEYSAAAE